MAPTVILAEHVATPPKEHKTKTIAQTGGGNAHDDESGRFPPLFAGWFLFCMVSGT